MKSIFASKTFWFNALSTAFTLGGVLPPKYAAVIVPVANVGLRLLTNQAVSILPPSGDQK
jgi:hypothetical protein